MIKINLKELATKKNIKIGLAACFIIIILAVILNNIAINKRNNQRETDISIILTAAYQYSIDNNRVLLKTITNTPTEICAKNNCGALANLNALTINEKYLSPLPIDPSGPIDPNGTGYFISKGEKNKIIVSAPKAEGKKVLSVSK